jgi:hypothetical protein
MQPENIFEEELTRLANNFRPENGPATQSEIEISFGRFEIETQQRHQAERKTFAQGYDQRAIDAASAEIVLSLRKNMNSLHNMEQKRGSQEAIVQAKDAARRSIAASPEFQEQRSNAISEFAEQQAEQLKLIYDREAEALKANGFEPHLDHQAASVNEQHTDAAMRMAEILSNTRQDLERVEQMDALTKAEASLEVAKAGIEEDPAKAERRRAFFSNMNQIDKQAELQQERAY